MGWIRKPLIVVGAFITLTLGVLPIAAGDPKPLPEPSPTTLVPNALVGWWNFDDCLASDQSPLERITHVNFSNEEVGCLPGAVGNAYRFRGVSASDHIEVNNEPPLKLTEGFSINLWFNIQSNRSYDGNRQESDYGTQVLIAKSDDRTGLSLRMERWRSNGRWHIYATNGRCCGTRPKAVPALEQEAWGAKLNQWYMITLTYNPTANEVKLYLDGRPRSTVKATDFDLNPQTDLEALTIGSERKGIWYPFNGLIDEVRVYKRSITALEVLRLFGQRTKK